MRRLIVAMLATIVCVANAATNAANDQAAEARVHAELRKHFPELELQQVRPTRVDGLFEVMMGDGTGYATADGKYLVVGTLYEVASRTNLTLEARSDERRAMLAQLDEKDMIVYPAANPKYTVTMFTDVDCAYCRKFHSQIAKYTELGITVRYVAYPRSGPGTPSWTTMEAVWCSSDRRDAITRAKRGESISKPANCQAPNVAAQYAAGKRIPLQGTPTLVLEDGGVVGGYLPPDQLVAELKKQDERVAAVVRH